MNLPSLKLSNPPMIDNYMVKSKEKSAPLDAIYIVGFFLFAILDVVTYVYKKSS